MTRPLDDEEFYLNQIPAPKRSSTVAKTIGNVIRKSLVKHGIASLQAAAITQQQWLAAVGPQLEPETRIGNVQRGLLYVEVRNTLVMQELHMRKREILAILHLDPALEKVRDLKLRQANF